MMVILKKPGENFAICGMDEQYRYDAAQELLGNITQESYWLNEERTLSMVCDEDGKLKQLPVNFYMEGSGFATPVVQFVGPVVFCKTKPVDPEAEDLYDYELDEWTQDDILQIINLLSEDQQFGLAALYAQAKERQVTLSEEGRKKYGFLMKL